MAEEPSISSPLLPVEFTCYQVATGTHVETHMLTSRSRHVLPTRRPWRREGPFPDLNDRTVPASRDGPGPGSPVRRVGPAARRPTKHR